MAKIATSWSLKARLFHWVSAPLVTAQWTIGLFFLGGKAMAGSLWLVVHLSLGLTILGLTICRLGFKLVDTVPARSPSRLVAITSYVGHIVLYGLLVIVPMTGWLGYRPAPFMSPPLLFSLLPMPVLSSVGLLSSRTWLNVHSIACWSLVVAVGFHVAAAFVHFSVIRDNVLQSMIKGDRPERLRH